MARLTFLRVYFSPKGRIVSFLNWFTHHWCCRHSSERASFPLFWYTALLPFRFFLGPNASVFFGFNRNYCATATLLIVRRSSFQTQFSSRHPMCVSLYRVFPTLCTLLLLLLPAKASISRHKHVRALLLLLGPKHTTELSLYLVISHSVTELRVSFPVVAHWSVWSAPMGLRKLSEISLGSRVRFETGTFLRRLDVLTLWVDWSNDTRARGMCWYTKRIVVHCMDSAHCGKNS